MYIDIQIIHKSIDYFGEIYNDERVKNYYNSDFMPLSDELINEFILIAKEEYGQNLTFQEAKEWAQNIVNYFIVLQKSSDCNSSTKDSEARY